MKKFKTPLELMIQYLGGMRRVWYYLVCNQTWCKQQVADYLKTTYNPATQAIVYASKKMAVVKTN